MHPINVARAAGLSQYETGKPCPKGHTGPRFVSSRQCVLCAGHRKKRWADANRGHIGEYNCSYYQDDAEYQRQRSRDYVAANRDSVLVKRRASYYADPAKATKWARENKERVRQLQRDWREANPEKSRAKCHNRRALKRNAGSHTAQDIIDIFAMQRGKCAYCRVNLGKKYHVDHVHALSRGGSNTRDNLQVLCQPCNQTKFTKDPIVFAQSLGMLL
jgi:5-methylcytosine-specific restriction endonuclease McrA